MDSEQFEMIKAIEILNQGGVVGMPTETVYGLAARIDKPLAIEKIFKTKERPFFDPLIVHVSTLDQARKLSRQWNIVFELLAQFFWPGPLTMVVPKSEAVSDLITSGLDSVGIRMPNHPLALKLINLAQCPLAAPSANKFGKTSPTSKAHVLSEFVSDDIHVVDGGECQIGIESTVIAINQQPQNKYQISILRPGNITKSQIEKVLIENNIDFQFNETLDKKASPGSMKHHYMPAVPLIVIDSDIQPIDAVLTEINQKLHQLPDEVESVKIVKPTGKIKIPIVISLPDDPTLAARNFYAELRKCSKLHGDCLIIYRGQKFNNELWEGLNDRLNKAASLII